MIVTQEVINQAHEMLQWDRVIMPILITYEAINQINERLQYDDDPDCEGVTEVPRTAAGLFAVCKRLEATYKKQTSLVILSWSVAEILENEASAIFNGRNWNLNLAEERQELEALQIFKSRYRKDLYEAGYVGDLDKRIPVVASIHASTGPAIVTVASNPIRIENEIPEKHNSMFVYWAS